MHLTYLVISTGLSIFRKFVRKKFSASKIYLVVLKMNIIDVMYSCFGR